MKKLHWLAMAAITVTLTAGSCGNTDPDDEFSGSPTPSLSGSPSPTPTTPANDLIINGAPATFTHTCGSSPCPQNFGTVMLINNSSLSADATTNFSGTGNLPFIMDVPNTTVPAGGSTTLNIQFNCGGWDGSTSVSGTLSVMFTNGTDNSSRDVSVSGSVIPCDP